MNGERRLAVLSSLPVGTALFLIRHYVIRVKRPYTSNFIQVCFKWRGNGLVNDILSACYSGDWHAQSMNKG